LFQLLTEQIEKEEKAGNLTAAQQLTGLRSRLLQVFEAMQQQSQRILAQADETLQAILAAEDTETAVRANLPHIDEAFMYLLATKIAQADQENQAEALQALNQVHQTIIKLAESQYPPEIVLLNQLMEAETEADQQQILNENQHLLSPDLVKVLEAVAQEFAGAGQEEVNGRLLAIKALVESRL